MDHGTVNPSMKLPDQGITGLGQVYYNYSEEEDQPFTGVVVETGPQFKGAVVETGPCGHTVRIEVELPDTHTHTL